MEEKLVRAMASSILHQHMERMLTIATPSLFALCAIQAISKIFTQVLILF
jgi:hypothetical protein